MSITIAHDTFVKFLQEQLAPDIPVQSYTKPQQVLLMNALNVRFLTDMNLIGLSVNEMFVSLDVLVDNTHATMSAERKAVSWIEDIIEVLKEGRTDQLYVNGAWTKGYIAWDILTPGGIQFKDVVQDSYVHKNLTLRVAYFR